MVEPTGLATLVVAGLASLFMAWAIGAGSSGSTPFAPAVGANAISVMRAGFVVGVLGLAGATLQGANVSETVGTGLVAGAEITAVAAVIALLTAATLVAVGVYTGYPIATAFTVTGAVLGVGVGLGGHPAWATLREILALWVLVPFVGGGVAYAVARGLQARDRQVVPLAVLGGIVGAIVANVEFAVLGDGTGASVAAVAGAGAGLPSPAGVVAATVGLAGATAAVVFREVRADAARGQRRFLLALGGLVAFSAGGSQVGLAVGPLLPLVGDEVPLTYVLLGGGAGLLAGSWTGAPRLIKAIAQDYSALGPSRSIAALVPAFAIAQTAVFFGLPVSFNEIVVSAIVGSGYASGGSGGVSREKGVYTALAWCGSLAVAFAGSFGVFAVVEMAS